MTQVDAREVIREFLREFGLADLTDVMWQRMGTGVITDDMTDDQKLLALKDQALYQQRFRANDLRRQRGLFELPPTEIVDMERSYQAILNTNQMPRSFYDTPDDYVNFIGADVSVAELQARIDEGYDAITKANPEAVRQMRELYGVAEPELAAYFLDPVRTRPIIERQARAARISAEARLQAGMQLSVEQAEQVAAEFQSSAQAGRAAQEAFGQISREQELFTPIAGEAMAGETAITQQEQIAGTFGTNAAAQQRIATRRRRRQAEFETGGGFAATQTGVSGLRSAEQ